MESWIYENLTGAEVTTISPTGYTNENIALAWLNHFIKHGGAGPNTHWRILLLDGPSSHRQNDCIIKCHKNHIVPFQFPSHMTHVLQPLDVGVLCSCKHYHSKAINNALHSLEMECTISSFFCDLNSIRKQTLQPYTIKHSFNNSAMFPVSFKSVLKKMPYYNSKGKGTPEQPATAISNPEASSGETVVSKEGDGDLELIKTPDSHFECQKGMAEWIDRAEAFSRTSKERFQQWAKVIEGCLAKAQLQEETYHNVQTRINDTEKCKAKSRRVIRKGGVITIDEARLKQYEKEVK